MTYKVINWISSKRQKLDLQGVSDVKQRDDQQDGQADGKRKGNDRIKDIGDQGEQLISSLTTT